MWPLCSHRIYALALTGLYGSSMASVMQPRQESSATTTLSSTTVLPLMSASVLSSVSSASSISTTESASTSATPVNTNDPGDLVTSTFTGSILAPSATTIPGSGLTVCNEDEAHASGFYPFCRPVNGSSKIVGNTYYVTWFPGAYSNGTQVTVSLDPFNSTTATNIWHSNPPTDKNLGFVYLPIDQAWLSGGNPTMAVVSIIANNQAEDQPANTTQGPIINLVPVPPAPPPPPPPHSSVSTLGLAIGLPVAFVVCAFVIAVLYFGMRKTRRIGLGSVMGRRKGYGVSKSRIQRLGGKRDAVGLAEQEVYPSEPIFRDDPLDNEHRQGRYQDSTREDRSRSAGNVFREELARQNDLR